MRTDEDKKKRNIKLLVRGGNQINKKTKNGIIERERARAAQLLVSNANGSPLHNARCGNVCNERWLQDHNR